MARKINPLPAVSRVRELLTYDHKAGTLVWNQSRGTRKKGAAAGWQHSTGYWYVRIDGRDYKLHRIVWLHYYGTEPKDLLDHIDRDKSNNKIRNLREATHAENQQNKRVYKNNRSGHKGVSWNVAERKWRVRIQIAGVNRLVGLYRTLDEAVAARKQAEQRLHTHAAS